MYQAQFDKAYSKIAKLQKKYLISKWVFLSVSIALLLMSAFNGLLSAYAIAKNPNLTAVWLFISISFISAVMAFLTATSTLFTFSKRRETLSSRLQQLTEREAKFKENPDAVDKDELVVFLATVDTNE
ncbi:DUF4231 domain-containing protein [Mycoplasma procyoni]|uniref:DUF4231 domain-containing protein n=1 Tax=Mycoplasma procyoni TaxID=568784 RepID=UPI00197BE98B|nr:DUF4231 domain-containing protein [Mycoplasma procyoni]MBN3534918.1 DUF4231 domain-containing protein [Mycoplasma procyoni]